MASVIVYSPRTSARLEYVLDWLLKDILHLNYQIIHDDIAVKDLDFIIAYGKIFDNAVSIPDAALLWEENIYPQKIEVGKWNKMPTLFATNSECTLPFDFFSASFFLLSRYEEYYPYAPDKHGRYAAELSLLYQHQLLQRPLIDEWVFEFCTLLQRYNIKASLKPFSFQPTYDIDIAYSYKYKGFGRTIGALGKDLLEGRAANVYARAKVLRGKEQDPYDSFKWLKQTHTNLGLQPIYFILAALSATPFDKNISPLHPEMQKLVKRFLNEGTIGLHPSYYATQQNIFKNEKSVLENSCGYTIEHSRQHYIRLVFPETYRRLIEQGIKEDWSMGYGSKLGFRAGTGRSFFWYDLQNEMQTNLRVHPFCFMDSTAHFEEKLSVTEAFERLNSMQSILQRTESRLVTVFHNFSLGTDSQWSGWPDAYYNFLRNLSG